MMKTRSPKVQKANNKSFEILELYEDEVLIFHNNSNRKQTTTNTVVVCATTTNTISRRPVKRKIMLVIPSR